MLRAITHTVRITDILEEKFVISNKNVYNIVLQEAG